MYVYSENTSSYYDVFFETPYIIKNNLKYSKITDSRNKGN